MNNITNSNTSQFLWDQQLCIEDMPTEAQLDNWREMLYNDLQETQVDLSDSEED